MTSASIIQFPSRGPAMLDREPLPTNLRRSRAGAVSFTSQEHMGQNSNPARKVIIVRWTAPATGETGAYCANLSSLTIRGAITDDLMNSFRALVPGNLLLRALQACQQTARGISNALRSFRGFVALFHEQTMNRGAPPWNEKPFPNPTTALLRIR